MYKESKHNNLKPYTIIFRMNYSRTAMFMTLLLLAFEDAVREGDGESEELCLKFMLPVFRKTGATKYALICMLPLVYNKCCISVAEYYELKHNGTVGM